MISNNDKGRAEASELRRRAEKILHSQSPETRALCTELEMQRLLYELQVHQIELEMQNTELSRSRDELESRVKERTAELERINKELELFCYTISHEFRAPIARLKGFSSMLIELTGENDKDSIIHCARRIMNASTRLSDVIDALLTLNRLSRCGVHLQKLNLSDMVGQIVSGLLEDRGRTPVTILIDPDVKVTGDRNMLEICMRNLLENAIKYSSKTPDASVAFGKRSIAGEEVYFVKDNGVGFEIENSKNIFQPFCRLHNEDEFEGTGIGLATVHRIIEKHNGRIWYESNPGQGTTFYFTIGLNMENNRLLRVHNGH